MGRANNIPAISVIVPVFGVEQYIERCVRSLMEQTIDNIEYIFVDDATPDRSIEILKNTVADYPARLPYVKILHQPENQGVASARNRGLAEANGNYIYYCDSDDYLSRQMLESLYAEAEKRDLDLVWCNFYFDEGNTLIEEITAELYDDKVEMLKAYLSHGWNVLWNTICKKELYLANDIKSRTDISFCEDYEIMVRLLTCASSWGKVDKALYYYNRANNNSIVRRSLSQSRIIKTVDDELIACQSIYDFMAMKGFRDELSEELSWRNLKAKRGLLYPLVDKKRYVSLWPEANKYIGSVPFCSKIDLIYLRLACHSWGFPVINICNHIRSLIN